MPGLPPPSTLDARHIVLVIAHGLQGDLPPLNDLPNLQTMRRLGISIERCATGGRSSLETLLLNGTGGGLAGASARGGRGCLQVLPWRPASWVARRTSGAHCSIVDDRLDDGTGTWQGLMEAKPQVVSGGDGGDVADFLRDNVLPRFPGEPTMRHAGTAPLEAWMTWVSDAFLRALWYASSRWPGGVVAVLCHPAPRLLARHDSEGGFLDGLAVVDDLIGRLLVLSEHRELDGSAVILCGDAGAAAPGQGDAALREGDAAGGTVPVLMAGGGIERGRLTPSADLVEVGRWLRELAATPAGGGGDDA
ncbi:MAG TPA: hypothetical protein VF282_09320 [Bacillota bacterium]